MKRLKKIALGAALLTLLGGGTLFCINGKDHYDASKYNATIRGGIEHGGIQKNTTIDLTLPDQFDVAHTIGPEVTTLILAFSKDSGGTVRGYLDNKDAGYLKTHNAVFIADISSFPVFVRNTFALPKLRKSPYSVLLLYEGKMAKALSNKQQSGKITIARLANRVVQDVAYISSAKELARVFGE